jgi:hypothetical protein
LPASSSSRSGRVFIERSEAQRASSLYSLRILVYRWKPLVPHGDHRELVPQHAGGVQGGLAGTEYRDGEPRSQGVQPGVAHGVDADGVVALLLGLEPHFEYAHVHQQRVVVAVAQGGAPLHGHELDIVAVAYALGGELRSAVGHAGLVHRDGYDDLDALGHRLASSYCA